MQSSCFLQHILPKKNYRTTLDSRSSLMVEPANAWSMSFVGSMSISPYRSSVERAMEVQWTGGHLESLIHRMSCCLDHTLVKELQKQIAYRRDAIQIRQHLLSLRVWIGHCWGTLCHITYLSVWILSTSKECSTMEVAVETKAALVILFLILSIFITAIQYLYILLWRQIRGSRFWWEMVDIFVFLRQGCRDVGIHVKTNFFTSIAGLYVVWLHSTEGSLLFGHELPKVEKKM